ncbi:MAG: hypothetical protein KC422_12955 [Trueperaceae bacterium]|nr:hypothetical protein [Trueperaceae bacterium]
MSFIQFRNGQALTLSSGEPLRYAFLREQGFSDHQARAVYMAALDEGMSMKIVKEWISDFKDPKRKAQRVQALNAIVQQNAQVSSSETQVIKQETPRRRGGSSKTFTLYSRSNHQEAEKRAREFGLSPKPAPKQGLPEGVANDALTVQADKKTASSLITTGYWRTA